MGDTVRILREGDVRAALDMASCIDAVDRAFAAYSSGAAELPGVIHLDVPETEGEVHVKAGHLHGAPYYAVKAASGFYGRQPAAIDGTVVVFDARDGSPAAFLLDHGYLTDVRTGAAGGVAARHLAPEGVGTVEAAVEGADVVITCTASRAPLVRAEWLKRGVLVTALGSDGPEKQELDVGVFKLADLVVVDSRDQCARIGELHHALDAELVLSPDDVTELGELCAGRKPGRTSEEQTIVCDLTGVGVQDVAAANVVMERIGDAGEVFEL